MAKQDELISSVINRILNESVESKDLGITLSDFLDLYRAIRELHGKPNKQKQRIYEIVTQIHARRSRT